VATMQGFFSILIFAEICLVYFLLVSIFYRLSLFCDFMYFFLLRSHGLRHVLVACQFLILRRQKVG